MKHLFLVDEILNAVLDCSHGSLTPICSKLCCWSSCIHKTKSTNFKLSVYCHDPLCGCSYFGGRV